MLHEHRCAVVFQCPPILSCTTLARVEWKRPKYHRWRRIITRRTDNGRQRGYPIPWSAPCRGATSTPARVEKPLWEASALVAKGGRLTFNPQFPGSMKGHAFADARRLMSFPLWAVLLLSLCAQSGRAQEGMCSTLDAQTCADICVPLETGGGSATALFSCGDWWTRSTCCNGTEEVQFTTTNVYFRCSCNGTSWCAQSCFYLISFYGHDRELTVPFALYLPRWC